MKIEVNGKTFIVKIVPVRTLKDVSTGKVRAIFKAVINEN